MNEDEIIQNVYDTYGEWIEMSDDPAAFVAGVLAKKIINLKGYIEYLEKITNAK